MKIWENFKTKANFGDIKNKRECWSICDVCKDRWEDIKTDHVHMTIKDKGETRFICDNCKPIKKQT